MPIWLLLLLMVLAVYRFTRLVVKDTFPPVLRVRDRLAGGWRPATGEEMRDTDLPVSQLDLGHGTVSAVYNKRSSRSPYWLAELLSCSWCASGWVSGAVTAAVALTVGLPSPWLAGPAVWGAAALLASRSWA
jgi:hypothetical protein